MNQLEQPQFQVEALLLPVVQVVEGAQHNLQIARQLFLGKQQRSARCARPLVAARSAATRSVRRPAWPSAHCAGSGPSVAPATTGCARRSPARSTASISSALCPAATASSSRSKTALGTEPINSRICAAESAGRPASTGAEAIAWSMIESASRIEPSPASASSASAASSAVTCSSVGNHLQLRQNVVELDRVKTEVLAARANRLRNVLRLRRRHHEDHVRRRLFQRLQQRIEGCLGNLVRLVENVNLVPVARRRIARRIPQLANLVNAAIGRRIDLDHVYGVALAHLEARIAHPAWLRRRPARRSPLPCGNSAPSPQCAQSWSFQCPDVLKIYSRAPSGSGSAHSSASASRGPGPPRRQSAAGGIFWPEPGNPCVILLLGAGRQCQPACSRLYRFRGREPGAPKVEKRFEAGSLSPLPAYRGVLLKASIFSNCMSELSWNGVGVNVSRKMTRPDQTQRQPAAAQPRLNRNARVAHRGNHQKDSPQNPAHPVDRSRQEQHEGQNVGEHPVQRAARWRRECARRPVGRRESGSAR